MMLLDDSGEENLPSFLDSPALISPQPTLPPSTPTPPPSSSAPPPSSSARTPSSRRKRRKSSLTPSIEITPMTVVEPDPEPEMLHQDMEEVEKKEEESGRRGKKRKSAPSAISSELPSEDLAINVATPMSLGKRKMPKVSLSRLSDNFDAEALEITKLTSEVNKAPSETTSKATPKAKKVASETTKAIPDANKVSSEASKAKSEAKKGSQEASKEASKTSEDSKAITEVKITPEVRKSGRRSGRNTFPNLQSPVGSLPDVQTTEGQLEEKSKSETVTRSEENIKESSKDDEKSGNKDLLPASDLTQKTPAKKGKKINNEKKPSAVINQANESTNNKDVQSNETKAMTSTQVKETDNSKSDVVKQPRRSVKSANEAKTLEKEVDKQTKSAEAGESKKTKSAEKEIPIEVSETIKPAIKDHGKEIKSTKLADKPTKSAKLVETKDTKSVNVENAKQIKSANQDNIKQIESTKKRGAKQTISTVSNEVTQTKSTDVDEIKKTKSVNADKNKQTISTNVDEVQQTKYSNLNEAMQTKSADSIEAKLTKSAKSEEVNETESDKLDKTTNQGESTLPNSTSVEDSKQTKSAAVPESETKQTRPTTSSTTSSLRSVRKQRINKESKQPSLDASENIPSDKNDASSNEKENKINADEVKGKMEKVELPQIDSKTPSTTANVISDKEKSEQTDPNTTAKLPTDTTSRRSGLRGRKMPTNVAEISDSQSADYSLPNNVDERLISPLPPKKKVEAPKENLDNKIASPVAISTPKSFTDNKIQNSAEKSADSLKNNGLISPTPMTPSLPPKKFFKSKATLKEMPPSVESPVTTNSAGVKSPTNTNTISPPAKASIARGKGGFLEWLNQNRSPNNSSVSEEQQNRSSRKQQNRRSLNKSAEFPNNADDECSSPEKSSTPAKLVNGRRRSAAKDGNNSSMAGNNSMSGEDSVYDLDSDVNLSTDSLDLSPSSHRLNASPTSKTGLKSPQANDETPKSSGKSGGKAALEMSEAELQQRREKKRAKKERKRAEKLRRKQLQIQQQREHFEQEDNDHHFQESPEPDIEENGTEFVMRIAPRIAPKPIKIKIKPILPPPPPSHEEGGRERKHSSDEEEERPPSSSAQNSGSMNMHPKKKMAHLQNGELEENDEESNIPDQDEPSGFLSYLQHQPYLSLKSPGHSIPSLKPHHYNLEGGGQGAVLPGQESASSPAFIDSYRESLAGEDTAGEIGNDLLLMAATTSNSINTSETKSCIPDPSSNIPEGQGSSEGQGSKAKGDVDNVPPSSDPGKENIRTRPSRRERAASSGSLNKKARGDTRTKCDVCQGEGTNTTLVRCDECAKCFHFGCLNPPVKKSPKVPGWSWSCSDCAPSDVDKSWHL